MVARPKKPGSGHEKDIHAILTGLGLPKDDPVAQTWLTYAGGLHERAHRHALNPPRPLDQEFVEFFNGMQDVLREVLTRFETRFGGSFRLIDELLAKSDPANEDAKRLKQSVPNTLVTYRRFFEGIPDGRWLESLREEGFFANLPGPETDEEGTGVLPSWPQSGYLVRVAAVEPEKVKEIVLELPNTENVRVHEDVAEAACAMPPRLAAEVVPKVMEGLDSPYYTSALPRNLGELVAHLASGGFTEEALRLARELLALVPQEDEGGEVALLATRDPRPRFRPPEVYGEVIEVCLEPLIDAAGERTFETLCDLLEDAIRVSLDLRTGEESEYLRYEDGVYMLRPAIEDSPYNDDCGPLGETSIYRLLSAVRDAGEQIAAADPSTTARLAEALEAKDKETFDRLALHLLRSFSNAPGVLGLTVERLKGKLTGLSPGLFHEHALLLRDRFQGLPNTTTALSCGIRCPAWASSGRQS